MARIFFAIFISVLISGCANVGLKSLSETDSDKAATARTFERPPNGYGALRIYHWTALSKLSGPLPGRAIAIDGRLSLLLPWDSFGSLVLQPGRHTITLLQLPQKQLLGDKEIPLLLQEEIEISEGEEKYIRVGWNIFSATFDQMSDSEGRALAKKLLVAKAIHQGVSIQEWANRISDGRIGDYRYLKTHKNEFVEESARLVAAGSSHKVSSTPPNGIRAEEFKNAAGEFFGVVATIALIGLLVLGMAASQKSTPSTPPSAYHPAPALAFDTNEFIGLNSTQRVEVKSKTGRILHVEKGNSPDYLINSETGTRYRLEGDRIYGSDGSRFRVSGNAVISDNGQVYRRYGNTIYSDNGGSCQVIGSFLNCN